MAKPVSTEVSVVTEALPEVITAASAPMKLEQMSQMIGYMEQFVQNLLKPGVDYGLIPGTKKPTLYKAGAEKLCFAFSLSPHYEILSEEHDRAYEWEYTTKVNGEKVSKKAKGYHRYQVKCTLIHRSTDVIWATCIGECESTERGRETAPSNTIVKLAEKRSYDGATLHATFTSDRFTADMDTYAQASGAGSGPTSEHQAKGIPQPSAHTASQYGTKDKPSKCNFCGKYHTIKGDLIVQHPGPGDLKGKWGRDVCYEATFKAVAKANEPPPETEQPRPEAKDSADLTRAQIIKEIPDLEAKRKSKVHEFNALDARKTALETTNLNEATDDDLVQYRYMLQDEDGKE